MTSIAEMNRTRELEEKVADLQARVAELEEAMTGPAPDAAELAVAEQGIASVFRRGPGRPRKVAP